MTFARLAGAALLAGSLAGCAIPATVWIPAATAGLGFGTATMVFNTEALKVWSERHPAAPPPPARP